MGAEIAAAPMLPTLFIVGSGGFLGAVLRFLLSSAMQKLYAGTWPFGTFVVNALGCFGFGLLAGWVHRNPGGDESWRAFLSIGLLGAFTTFSTFTYDAVVLIREGRSKEALVYLLASLVVGLIAFLLGELLI